MRELAKFLIFLKSNGIMSVWEKGQEVDSLATMLHKLDDHFLLDAYKEAIHRKLDIGFIKILLTELQRRGLEKK